MVGKGIEERVASLSMSCEHDARPRQSRSFLRPYIVRKSLTYFSFLGVEDLRTNSMMI